MYNKQFRIKRNCMCSGVYIILNLDNRKVYIGSTRDIQRRLKEHEINLRSGKHSIKQLQDDYNSGNKFIGYIITKVGLITDNEYCKDDNLRYFESLAIKEFASDNPDYGYNKRADKRKLREIENIKWAKKNMDSYFFDKQEAKKRIGNLRKYYSDSEKNFVKQNLE